MSELSMLWTHPGGAGDGASAMTRVDWANREKIVAACSGYQGVAPAYLNSLAGTVTGANTVAINTGGAVVDGHAYQNDASLNVNIPSAVGGGNTRIDRIVLRCSWAAQTVRVTRIAGTDAASPAVPAITQTPGTTYDIPLYKALVNTVGTVTLTDERVMASLVAGRQGGSASDWSTVGLVNYIPSGWKIQVGSVQWTGASIFNGNTALTFPVAFSAKPIVFVNALTDNATAYAWSITTSGATLSWGCTSAQTIMNMFWIAIGPA